MKRLNDNSGYVAWAAALLSGLPLFAWQAYRLRRDTPRLEEAPGPREGEVAGEAPVIRLAVIGESTAAGVGAPDHARGLAGRSAAALAARTGRAVRWSAHGHNGATARQTRYRHVPEVDRGTGVVVVALGVNDVLSGCAPETWRHNLEKLLASTRRRAPGAIIVVSAVPPMGHFPAIPQPLRALLGVRAQAFDRISALVAAACPRALYVPLPYEGGSDYFCEDRFHPSALGYDRWGTLTGEAAALRIQSAAS
ncbi:SGNH/GDSL hydrolase family protein [Algiphilus sp.]|uniref:SGNH/GDSL hydrolase family protein n=1 Tax=Algiphilus sp. TaxID=1872431 RepID=UPI003C3EEF0A